MTRPNGVTTNYTYDNLSRLLSVLHQLSGSTIDGAVYTVDAAGNRTSKADQLANVTSNYSYDAIYELTQVTQGATTTESYSYDPVGNRLSSLGMSPYQYNPSNEMVSTPSALYAYDNNGNLTSETNSTGTTNYAWDFENRLTQVTLPNSSGTVSFKYDPFGRRIQKVSTQNSSSTTTNYVYNGSDIRANTIEQVDNVGNILARYAQGPGIDRPLAESITGTTSYYEQDGLGSVTSLRTSTGALAKTDAFDSYGKLTASSGTLSNPFQFTGREFDPETQLYFYRSRYYDNSAGRFLSEDPTGFDGGNDFYAYVKNNPVAWIDPLGLVECWYSIIPHYLSCTSDDGTQTFNTSQARSGNGLCMNNPGCIQTHDQGPIPSGNYGMGRLGNTPNPHNPPRVYLSPLSGTMTFTRTGFEIHPLGRKGSEGCIVLDPSEYNRFRTFYANDNSGLLHVP